MKKTSIYIHIILILFHFYLIKTWSCEKMEILLYIGIEAVFALFFVSHKPAHLHTCIPQVGCGIFSTQQ